MAGPLGAKPVTRHRVANPSALPGQWPRTAIDASSAHHTAQDEGNDDRIVGITEHRNDVWHQVDRLLFHCARSAGRVRLIRVVSRRSLVATRAETRSGDGGTKAGTTPRALPSAGRRRTTRWPLGRRVTRRRSARPSRVGNRIRRRGPRRSAASDRSQPPTPAR